MPGPLGAGFFFSGTTSHSGHVKVSDTKQQSKEARAQGWELLQNGVVKKKEKEKKKKSRARLEPQGREALPRRCNHILTLPPLMRAEGAPGILTGKLGGRIKHWAASGTAIQVTVKAGGRGPLKGRPPLLREGGGGGGGGVEGQRGR